MLLIDISSYKYYYSGVFSDTNQFFSFPTPTAFPTIQFNSDALSLIPQVKGFSPIILPSPQIPVTSLWLCFWTSDWLVINLGFPWLLPQVWTFAGYVSEKKQKNPTNSKRYVHPSVHSSIVYNCQDMEAT